MGNKKEIFTPIKGFEGIYSISNYGRVYSHPRVNARGSMLKGKFLAIGHNTKGYPHVQIRIDGKPKTLVIHRIVAEHFLCDWDADLTVDHIDTDKCNNYVKNLRMCTNEQNNTYKKQNSLPTGVTKRRNKYRANICVNGERRYLGCYETMMEAELVYKKAKGVIDE